MIQTEGASLRKTVRETLPLVTRIPLLSQKHFTKFSPEEYIQYVRSLHALPKRRETSKRVSRDVSLRLTVSGKPVLTIRNRPLKYVLKVELEILAQEAGIPQNVLWVSVRGRKDVQILAKPPTDNKETK